MESLYITKQQARQFLLAYQGLLPPFELKGKTGIMEYFQRVRCVQFDPLNIAGQNAELVLQARVADFQPSLLQDLLYKDRLLVDGWDKNMSIFPVEDWPYFKRMREQFWNASSRTRSQAREIIPQIRQAFEERGPLSSLDLDYGQKVDWWWAPTRLARAALDLMYLTGELIVHHKVNTRKVYDLAERWIPAHILNTPDPNQSEEDYYEWHIERRIGSVGMLWNRAGDAWLGFGLKATDRLKAMKRLAEKGRLLEVKVEGIAQPLYIRRQDLPLMEQTLVQDVPSPKAALVAPLDNLVWERKLLDDLFGFYYRWEVYTPAEQRQYGYYVLPVLYGDRFIARCEPVLHKKKHILAIKNWWWEDHAGQNEDIRAEVRLSIERFATFLGAREIVFENGAEEKIWT